jgi:hypothetical protein
MRKYWNTICNYIYKSSAYTTGFPKYSLRFLPHKINKKPWWTKHFFYFFVQPWICICRSPKENSFLPKHCTSMKNTCMYSMECFFFKLHNGIFKILSGPTRVMPVGRPVVTVEVWVWNKSQTWISAERACHSTTNWDSVALTWINHLVSQCRVTVFLLWDCPEIECGLRAQVSARKLGLSFPSGSLCGCFCSGLCRIWR